MLPSLTTSLEQSLALLVRQEVEKAVAPLHERLSELEGNGPLTLTVARARELAGGNISDPTARLLIAKGEWLAKPLNDDAEGSKLLVDRASVVAWWRRKLEATHG